MRTFIPILCIAHGGAIHVTPSPDSDALFKHCYELMKLHAPRIVAFKMIPYNGPTAPITDKQIAMIDTIMFLLNKLGIRHQMRYNYNDLLKKDKASLEMIIDALNLEYMARCN